MRSRSGAWVLGVGLTAVGLLLLAVNLGLLPLDDLPLPPLLVVLAGVWLTADACRIPGRRGVTAGILVIAGGLFWIALSVGWLEEGHFLGVLLIALGVGVLLRHAAPGRR